MEIPDYCREIETYLCRKNDGHLIRVVGPSFELVSSWAARGVPLKVAYAGIDRYFERYYRNGPRRRPVKIDFCEADILDVFDEWRRAVGLTRASVRMKQSSVGRSQSSVGRSQSSVGSQESVGPEREPVTGESGVDADELRAPASRQPSLPAHLERVLLRLSSARARDSLGPELDGLLDRVSAELDAARSKAGGLRGAARRTLVERLAALDAELLQAARAQLDPAVVAALPREADEELAAFRVGLAPDAFARAREAAVDRLVRERLALPVIAFE